MFSPGGLHTNYLFQINLQTIVASMVLILGFVYSLYSAYRSQFGASETGTLNKGLLQTKNMGKLTVDLPQTNNLFVHLHIAKTAGSTSNRNWARKYHGVCGHKGYSFTQPLTTGKDVRNDPRFPGYRRDRVHHSRMLDWGFHNCALISHEIASDELRKILNAKEFSHVNKIALLPCREPIDHWFSQCNFKHLNASVILQGTCSESAKRCHVAWNRFNDNTLKIFDYVVLYKYSELEQVTVFLDQFLPKRSVELELGGIYMTNSPRKKSNEQFSDNCSMQDLTQTLKSAWSYYSTCDILGDIPMKVVRI